MIPDLSDFEISSNLRFIRYRNYYSSGWGAYIRENMERVEYAYHFFKFKGKIFIVQLL